MYAKNNAYNQIIGNLALNRERQRNVVYYGRVSTQHEAQIDALENQMQWYEDQSKYHPNWTVLGRYIDEGITGTLAKKRPSFMSMIEDARRGKFDLIVTREVCRFARNTVDTLVITRELKKYGVEVFFVEDNIWTMDGDGELRLTIMATLAQEESRKISERVKAGQAVSRENHVLYGSGNIIGYDRVDKNYVINPSQAETIRTVFKLYSQGLGQKAICNELTRRGDKDGNGKVNWSCVKISRILHNPTYMGYICYNRYKTNNYLEKKVIKNLDEDSIIRVKGNFEPIVSEELWNECRRIRESKCKKYCMPSGEERRMARSAPQHLWVKKLRCRCGAGYARHKWRVLDDGTPVYGYQCILRRRKISLEFATKHGIQQDSCKAISICQWKLELMAKRIFEHVWGDKKEVIIRACQMIESCISLNAHKYQSEENEIKLKLNKIEQRLLNYGQMRADGELSKDEYSKLREQANEERDNLRLQLEKKADLSKEGPQHYNINQMQKCLNEWVDISSPVISDQLIDEFVETITPIEDNLYRWKLNLDKANMPDVRYNLVNPPTSPVLTLKIDFENAKEYRTACGLPQQFRKRFWTDLTVEVYI